MLVYDYLCLFTLIYAHLCLFTLIHAHLRLFTLIYAPFHHHFITISSPIHRNESDKIVEFAPSEYRGFRHGYATTVFKAQGASIKDVYVFHDGFAGIRNSYVALSRNVNNLHLYINNEYIFLCEELLKLFDR